MASTHSQKVLKTLNEKLLVTFQKYYGDLKIGDMSPEEFIQTYGAIPQEDDNSPLSKDSQNMGDT
ncbi:hypothetical protein [Calothrix sp. NIES-3974]|uniref:hypothetical protein n=1 Tax=Calothrix sp. NIES-3974 TaxID=2005462 RepID=UPI000B5E1169|nr:hypothetical protein [Calothrix sp. NIES-3974]BAZ06550.1 hypothetical protein NIES3974_32110 [Calothrix sp. NIES-3974]